MNRQLFTETIKDEDYTFNITFRQNVNFGCVELFFSIYHFCVEEFTISSQKFPDQSQFGKLTSNSLRSIYCSFEKNIYDSLYYKIGYTRSEKIVRQTYKLIYPHLEKIYIIN